MHFIQNLTRSIIQNSLLLETKQRKDVNNLKAIPAFHHLKAHGHNFIKYAKFTLKE